MVAETGIYITWVTGAILISIAMFLPKYKSEQHLLNEFFIFLILSLQLLMQVMLSMILYLMKKFHLIMYPFNMKMVKLKY